ncbi:flagellar protein FlaG [Lachnospiraceae bacterium C10]|jgi:flagellar protein FlaG|nr:flagellar protein FlaG [Lachnospiraceae bacterium C10]
MGISTSGVSLAEHGSYAPAAASRPVENIQAEVQEPAVEEVNTTKATELSLQKQKTENSAEGTEEQEEEQDRDAIRKVVSEINKNAGGTEAIFGIHDETNRVTIKIVDKETKKVLKEVPPEKTLDMIAKVWELAGLLVDEKR